MAYRVSFSNLGLVSLSFVGLIYFSGTQAQQQVSSRQTSNPNYELRVGARNSTIRNIGSFQTDSALIFPKRLAKDTTNSKALKRNGVFFYDSVRNVLWYCDGEHFYSGLGGGLYSSDGSLRNTPQNQRTVDVNGKQLLFKRGNVMIGSNDIIEKDPKIPVRFVVNTDSYKGSLKLNGIDTNEVAILANVGNHDKKTSRYGYKYGLLIREASYDANSKIAIGFYSGGDKKNKTRDKVGYNANQSSSLAARIWGSMGDNIANPQFGIDAATGTDSRTNQSLNSYNVDQTTSMKTRFFINRFGNIGMGSSSPKVNLEVGRPNNNNVIRIHSGGHNQTAWQSALWLTVQDSDTGWYISHSSNTGLLNFRYTTKKAVNGNSTGENKQYSTQNKSHESVLALIPEGDGGHIGIGTKNYVQGNILIDVQRENQSNYLRIQAGSTNQEKLSGLWLTKHNITSGWRIQFNPQNNQLQFKQTSIDGYGDGRNSGIHVFITGEGSGTSIVAPHFYVASDSTLKKQIYSLSTDLPDKLMQLKPVSYF